jgi:hypothetical protein
MSKTRLNYLRELLIFEKKLLKSLRCKHGASNVFIYQTEQGIESIKRNINRLQPTGQKSI